MGKSRKAGVTASRVKVTITLDGPMARRLATYSRYHGKSMGSVVTDALGPALRGFSVVQRGASADGVPTVEPEREREREFVGPPDLRIAG